VTGTASTRRDESVCRRVASTDETVVGICNGLPVEGVKLIPGIGRVKLSKSIPLGGVSKSVMLRVAFPVLQFVVQRFLRPLQEFNETMPIAATNTNEYRKCMQNPATRAQ
jgi:phosphoribosylformylglycinamidine (FGAM) synthase-like amidotransferase family enzyme